MQPSGSPENKPFDLCERTFEFALKVVRLCQHIDRQRSNAAWALSKQILRSATSVGANVEEAQGAPSRADFVSKYSIARKELRETGYWLRLLLASGIVEPADGKPLLAETGELLRILTAIIKKVRCD
jgi:four helix bundle protein